MAIQEGRYTLVYPNGEYRTLRVKVAKKGNLMGRVILALKVGKDFIGCGFLQPSGKVNFWNRFKSQNPPERLVRVQKAVDRVLVDPDAAGLAYAMKENCCFRCGRDLTVPASIHKGMGPECARKNWTRKDQQAAYQWRAGQAKSPRHQAAADAMEAQRKIDFDQNGPVSEQEMDRMVQVAENEQEARAHMRSPDFYDPKADFWSQPCGICKVPRNQCSC